LLRPQNTSSNNESFIANNLDDQIKKLMKKNSSKILILPDIRSALNVGAIFRTADAIGIKQNIFSRGNT
jgi:tRNA G18 (ribose-2'-O)-methylase SpoU